MYMEDSKLIKYYSELAEYHEKFLKGYGVKFPRLKSKGELIIEKLLKENNINYLYDYALFKDLYLSSGGIGRYDFILLDKDYTPYRLIEYDGE